MVDVDIGVIDEVAVIDVDVAEIRSAGEAAAFCFSWLSRSAGKTTEQSNRLFARTNLLARQQDPKH